MATLPIANWLLFTRYLPTSYGSDLCIDRQQTCVAIFPIRCLLVLTSPWRPQYENNVKMIRSG